MQSNPAHTAYYAAVAADDAWHAELARVYGTNAGVARYDARGTATPTLATLHAAVRTANDRRQHAAAARLGWD